MDGTVPTDDPVNQMILALWRLNSAFAASNRVVGKALGLKNGDFAVLDALDREGPRTPTGLARRTRTHAATMTEVLARLEGDGWIERRPSPVNCRSVRVHTVGVDRPIEVYFRVNEELAEHVSGWPVEQMKMIIRFLAGVDDIATVFPERMATERGS